MWWDKVNYQLRLPRVMLSDDAEPIHRLCSVNLCRAKCKFKQTVRCDIVSYTLADLELNLAERRLALQLAALDLREQRHDLPVEAERPTEDVTSRQQRRRLWWRYY